MESISRNTGECSWCLKLVIMVETMWDNQIWEIIPKENKKQWWARCGSSYLWCHHFESWSKRIKSSRPANLHSKIGKEKKTQTKCDCEQENKNESWGVGEYMSSGAKITDAFKGLGSGTAAAICWHGECLLSEYKL